MILVPPGTGSLHMNPHKYVFMLHWHSRPNNAHREQQSQQYQS
jgi:hypothetical protein